jgi:hypothetical protein
MRERLEGEEREKEREREKRFRITNLKSALPTHPALSVYF